MDVDAWLHGLGLSRYAQAFRDNDVDDRVLPGLTADDLKEIGVTSVGHRRLMLQAIAALPVAPSSSATVTTEASIPPAAPASPHAERRQLTVMFIDLVGSTALSARLDPEEMRTVLLAYQNAAAVEVTRCGGHVAKLMGDGLLAYFGWPRADEDEAERAVRAGLAIIEAVGCLATPAEEQLAARVGIATGLVVVGDIIGEAAAQEEAVVGETPNLAARLQAIAPPGTVIVAEETRQLLGEAFDMHPLDQVHLKGFAQPVAGYQVISERSANSRFEAKRPGQLLPMVGREQELALVLERWRQATAGEGQAVLLVGEAGIGKSRLVRGALDAVADDEHIALRYQCSPHHTGTALWPVAQQIRVAAGFAADEDEAARLDKLEALLQQGAEDSLEVAPLVAGLLGLDTGSRYAPLELTPQQRRARTLAVLIEQLLGLARRHPVLMVLEDAHWIDPTTLELVGLALDRIASARVLLLLTTRPDNQPALGGHPHVTRLTLNRLGREATETIVRRLANDRILPPGLPGEIAARTDGVPLFVEELTKAVLEAGAAGVAVPVSLHASLMARLDRVPGVKEVAQVAACIGREFTYPLLAAVSPMPEAGLQAALDRLAAAELVFARGEPPEASYTFKHALVRDAAYESLLKAERQRLHSRIVQVLAERFPETVIAEPELLARHAEAAGEIARAVDLWAEAGRAATRRYANAEAIRHLEAGLRLLPFLPETEERDRRELGLRLAAGPSLIAVKGHAAREVGATYDRARELAERLADGDALFAALRGLWNCVHDRGELEQSLTLAERLVAVAGRRDDLAEQALAWRALGTSRLIRGELTHAIEALDRGLEACSMLPAGACLHSHGEAPAVICAQYAGWAHTLAGRPDTGLALVRQGLAEARRLRHPVSLAFALALGSIALVLRREPRACETAAKELLALSREYGFTFYATGGEIFLGWARARAGDLEGGIELMSRGLSGWRASGTVLHIPTLSALLVEALLDAARTAEAAAVLEDALGLALSHHDLYTVAELHRLRGRLALAQERPDDAVRAFSLALDCARARNGKLLELRAGTSLAGLWVQQGKRQQARDLLLSIHGWFTEGFDLPDLQEAKALLDML
ncbi:MAG TPA: adenylate/guanylate cyclase domain-containing protein [Geminicoccus sp.]|uniref:adenylate/guanylate cyclase domain-containing protein n=1 Tax=Geminicoccus sp. TaxID=2024832 RepID=UPI002E2F5794|nr:adenylate/guanylate cyclase domain-containing protein [Geminicoccus sp.]HEX2527181.1 adenylate/guanylate cyclase domain-containing protein [Geminicoccus sp.]